MKNPFEGMKRKRLPGMNMITACDGGIPLNEALASHFFIMLHDKVKHHCLIKEAQEKHKSDVEQATGMVKTPEGKTIGNIFGIMAESSLIGEEWSYLDNENALTFLLIASTAIDQIQRWISNGKEKPCHIPLGDLVERPHWAVLYYADPKNRDGEAEELIQKLQSEVAEQGTVSR